jgi:hypothetical protein
MLSALSTTQRRHRFKAVVSRPGRASGLGNSISLRLPSGYRISRALCKMRVGAYITGYASQSRSEGTQAFCLNRTRAKIVGDQGRGKIGRHSKRVGEL